MADHFLDETIRIDNLRVECIIGVNPGERTTPQPLLISLRWPADFGPAAASEALEQTVNYAAVARAAREFAVAGRFRLLETLVRGLALHLCERFGLDRIEVTIRKPQAVADSDGPAVSLTLARTGEGQR